MKSYYCIECPNGCQLTAIGSGFEMVVEGNKCAKGREFAEMETKNTLRTLTTTVKTKFPGIPVISVRTDGEIPKDKLMDAMRVLSDVVVEEELECGDVIVEDIVKTGVSVIITSSALMRLGEELENKNVELNRRGSSSSGSATESGTTPGQGIGVVRSADALDAIGHGAAGGVVGAAGEAVGVEGEADEDELEFVESSADGAGHIRSRSRPHIKR